MYLYMITNSVNDKSYVGITVNVSKRWTWHKHNAKAGKGHALHRAIRKHGIGNFSIRVLAEASCDDALKLMECETIAGYRTMVPDGYNLTAGGDGLFGLRHRADTLRKMSAAAIRTPEQRARLSMFHKGKKHSDETKQKLREARAKQPPTYGMLGKKMSDETRKKMSEAASGKRKSPETIERMKAAAKERMKNGRNGAINGKAARSKPDAGGDINPHSA